MKIRKYNQIEKKQVGGIIYTPYLPSSNNNDIPVQNTNQDNQDDLSDLQKETIDILKENGLPSDVNTFLNQANRFLLRARTTGDWTMNDFIRIQNLANRVTFNKNLYDTATKHLTETGNWNEIALNDKGQLYALDNNNNLLQIDPEKYYQNQDKYRLMTNNDILEYRSNAIPFDSSILNSMSGSIGMNDIIDYVKNIILDFGTKTISGYTNTEMSNIEQTLYNLMSNGPEGYYKFKSESKVDGSTAQKALTYLYNSLPNNMKQFLRAKTAAENQNPNEHSKDLLMLALANHTDTSLSVDFDSTATATKNNGSGSSGSTKEDTYLEHIVTGNTLGEYKDLRITPVGSKVNMNVKGQLAGPLIDRQGDKVQQNNLRSLLNNVYAFQVVDTNSITFGSQVIKQQDWDKIVWDESSQMIRVFLPYTINEEGKITPDFALQQRLEEFQKDVDLMGGQITPNIQQQIQNEFNGVVFYNPKTKKLQVNPDLVMPFLSISAYANSHTMSDLNTDDPLLSSVDTQTGKQIKNDYENATQYYMIHGKELGKDELVDQDKAKKRRFYRGNIFLPIISKTIGTHLSNGQEIPKDIYLDVNGSSSNSDIITTW